jgi:hypothetical protein
MTIDPTQVPLLMRREIEAAMAAPFIQSLIDELGREKALAKVRDIVQNMARQSGAQLAVVMGGNSLAHFKDSLKFWSQDQALEMEVLEQTDRTLAFNVTRCRYAEMYQELGLAEFGGCLSCDRDFALAEGFNPKLSLTRTKTILAGDEVCNFRYTME